jgi:hypothetical protein
MRRLFGDTAYVLLLALQLSMLVVAPAGAYLDPGSGSIIFQAVVGAALGISLTAKLFWRRIAAFFQRKNQ